MEKVRPSFKEQLKLAETIAEELGPPWRPSTKGRPALYSTTKLGAILMVKGTMSFVELAVAIKDGSYDPTANGSRRYPCPSELHWAFTEIPTTWLERALTMFDDRSARLYDRFHERTDLFGTDGGTLTGAGLAEVERLRRFILVRETYPYTALIRLQRNTIRALTEHMKRIEHFLPLLDEGAVVIGVPEFDVKDNYALAREKKIDLQVKQRKGEARGFHRKMARKAFDQKKYRKRRLCERVFGKLEVRGYRCHYRGDARRYKGVLLMGCAHNIIGYFKKRAWCEQFKVFRKGAGAIGRRKVWATRLSAAT